MSDSEFNLKHPPIVEAILDIECDLPPGTQIATLEDAARTCFRAHYPTYRQLLIQEPQFEAKPNEQPTLSRMRRVVKALQFYHEDEKQLVQIRPNGFSFNRLAPYTSLDVCLPEIERTWGLYIGLISPVQVRSIRLRYINRILLPPQTGLDDLKDFLTIGPRLPDEKKLSVVSFLHQHSAIEAETNYGVNIVLTNQPPVEGKLALIFDICVTAAESGDPQNWPWILDKIQALRNLKNRIFKESLTKSCLNLFSQL